MRKLLILCFFSPLMAWGQSSLPPCPEHTEKHFCFANTSNGHFGAHVDEFAGVANYGDGVLSRPLTVAALSGIRRSDLVMESVVLDQRSLPPNHGGSPNSIPNHAGASGQASLITEGRYFAQSDELVIEGELKGGFFVISKAKLTLDNSIITCGAGPSFIERLEVDQNGNVSGHCNLVSAVQGASRRATGIFPSITFTATVGAHLPIFTATFIPIKEKERFISALAAGYVSSTREWAKKLETGVAVEESKPTIKTNGTSLSDLDQPPSGIYFGHSDSLVIQGEFKGGIFYVSEAKMPLIGDLVCGFGLSLTNRIAVDRDRNFSAHCPGSSVTTIEGSEKRVSGVFPRIKVHSLSSRAPPDPLGGATLIPIKYKQQFLTALAAGRVKSSDQFLTVDMYATATKPDGYNQTEVLVQNQRSEPALPPMGWREALERRVQAELNFWLGSQQASIEAIPAPAYPAALSLKQDPWESNKEFEDRVDKARTERRQTIDRLQAEYKKRVDERNRQVAEFNKQQQERQAQLPQKRRELIQLGISVLNPAVSLTDAAFDQQSGALTVAAQVDGLGKQTFAFKDTPQAFRKSALTEPKTMKAKPEFLVSDAGEITLQGITVEAGGVTARGLPSAGITPSVQLATVNLPQATAPALVQQSAITVDRNQVEQILYREENDLLRKRLEDQRKQQEQALANEQAKAAAEIARIRAEAEALKKQQPVPVLNYAAVQDAHALVIGNSAYPGSNRLANPTNDAKAMTAKLRSLGFKVTEIANATREQMVRGLSEFSKTASRADLTLLFYAGHGVQISGTNYMIPIDMSLNDASQATLQAVSLNSVVEQYLPGKTKLVFLDACRDNPLMASVGRGITKGLAPINVSQGTLIAYATKDGQTADDGVGSKNSPFTSALLEHLGDPDDIAVVLRTVRAKVMERTNNRQQPWEYGSLTGGALVLSAIKR